MTKLKPCPYCGESAMIYVRGVRPRYMVCCSGHKCSNNYDSQTYKEIHNLKYRVYIHNRKEKAIRRWNKGYDKALKRDEVHKKRNEREKWRLLE